MYRNQLNLPNISQYTYDIHMLEAKPFSNPEFTDFRATVANETAMDADVLLKKFVYKPYFIPSVVQVEPNGRKTTLYNHPYFLCDGDKHFIPAYIINYYQKTLQMILKQEIKCPIEPKLYSIRGLVWKSPYLPLKLFYKPKSYFLVNVSVFESVTKSKSIYLGSLLMRNEISKRAM